MPSPSPGAAGLPRPGYSAISQAGSDLGVGPNAWMLNISFFITGLLVIDFAIGFFVEVRQMLGKRRRVACLILLILSGIGFITLGIFTEAPATVTLHWTLGLPLATLPPVVSRHCLNMGSFGLLLLRLT